MLSLVEYTGFVSSDSDIGLIILSYIIVDAIPSEIVAKAAQIKQALKFFCSNCTYVP